MTRLWRDGTVPSWDCYEMGLWQYGTVTRWDCDEMGQWRDGTVTICNFRLLKSIARSSWLLFIEATADLILWNINTCTSVKLKNNSVIIMVFSSAASGRNEDHGENSSFNKQGRSFTIHLLSSVYAAATMVVVQYWGSDHKMKLVVLIWKVCSMQNADWRSSVATSVMILRVPNL